MSTDNANKALVVGLLAGAAIIGGAVIFHLLQSKSSHSTSALIEEIDALGEPKKEMNGILSFPYFKDLMSLVQKHAKERFADEKKDMLTKRRQLLKDKKIDEYKELVSEMIKKEEANFQDLMMEVIDHIGISE
jgi:hypothetical protein